MQLVRVTLSETARTLDLKGRTARAPYLSFLLCTTSIFTVMLVLCIKLLPETHATKAIWLTTLIFYLPVTAAGARRLHDVGESGLLMLEPLKPLLAFGIVLGLFGLFSFKTFIGFVTLFLFGKVYVALISIAALITAVATLMYFSNTMGLLLLPSKSGPNKYGPNPNEVTQ